MTAPEVTGRSPGRCLLRLGNDDAPGAPARGPRAVSSRPCGAMRPRPGLQEGSSPSRGRGRAPHMRAGRRAQGFRGARALQEGKAASLAADFSITRFEHLGRLLVVHGRSSYKRSAALGQFVMHRGLIISTMQVPVGAGPRAGWAACGLPSASAGAALTCPCSLLQAVFSSVFYFASVPLYQGFLMVG